MKMAKSNESHAEIDYDAIGIDEGSVAVASPEIQKAVDKGLGLKPISIRLPETLLQELKLIADYRGVGYQPLIRDLLKRFTQAEFKHIAIELYNKDKLEREQEKQPKIA
jgi:hypothetical protein